MEAALADLGIDLVHVIGPATGTMSLRCDCRFPPDTGPVQDKGSFGTHVRRRTRVTRPFPDIFLPERQPKIDNERFPLLVNQNIARLDVAVHESPLAARTND